ncbi:MAG: MDR family MFS transporter [Candidatus Methanomethylophilus sp.]|nr:MDR family MFS transporter [Methanomethylophilus sp.]
MKIANETNITWRNIDPRVRKITMFGLTFAMLIACLDGTIVGTCGPVIAAELNGTDLYAWMITAYMLCETVMIPISGKMSDHYGRKPLFFLGLGLFVGGSILAGMSTSMPELIVFRAIQGLGGGTLIPVAMAAVGDFYPPVQRGKIQGMLGAVFGLGSAIGPLLGGYIASYFSWRWVFYVNIPLAALSLALTLKQFPKPNVDRVHKVDYLGMAVLGMFLIDLLLFFEWGGDEVPWLSVQAFAMVLLMVVLLAVFVRIEKKADDPVLGLHLFRNRTIVASMLFMAIFGLGMMGAMTYSSMFSIYIYGLTTLQAGELSLAMVAGMMITSLASGNYLTKTGLRPWLIAGPVITAAAMFMMSGLSYGSSVWDMVPCLFILGFGLGCMSSVVMVAVQNVADPREMGMTTSSVNLMRSIGSTIGTAVFAMFVGQRISSELAVNASAIYNLIPHSVGVLDVQWLQWIGFNYPAELPHILTSFANSVDFAFLVGGCIMVVLLFVGLLIKNQRNNVDITDKVMMRMQENSRKK